MLLRSRLSIARRIESFVLALFGLLWVTNLAGCVTEPAAKYGCPPEHCSPTDTITVKYGAPEPIDTMIAKYGSPVPLDTPIAKYGTPAPVDTMIARYGIPMPPDPITVKYGVPGQST
jgi:hypothetical protein